MASKMRRGAITLLAILLLLSMPIIHAAELRLTYDANGNLVSGDGKYRVYNDLNELWKIYNGSSINDPLLEEYYFHPMEERILQKIVYHTNGSVKENVYYITKNLVRISNDTGTFDFRYIYHEGTLIAQQNPDGSKLFIHSNHEGSVSVVSNSTGDVIENTIMTPFGEVLSGGTTTRYGYEGKEHDTIVGDTDFNFRKYKPEWALFLQPDSLIPDVYDPQELNRYMFERGNPYRHIDPTGHSKMTLPTFKQIANEVKYWVDEINKAWEATPGAQYVENFAITVFGNFKDVVDWMWMETEPDILHTDEELKEARKDAGIAVADESLNYLGGRYIKGFAVASTGYGIATGRSLIRDIGTYLVNTMNVGSEHITGVATTVYNTLLTGNGAKWYVNKNTGRVTY